MHHSLFLPRSLLLLLLLPSLLLLRPAATATAAAAADKGDESISSAQLTHLFPETPLFGYQLLCGATRRFRLHALARDKIYDLKVSYLASMPTTFTLEVARVAADDDRSDSDMTHVQRRLNTAKLRLHPSELLLRQQNADGRREAQHRLALPNDDSDRRELPVIVAVDVVLRADVAGVSPFVDSRTRACVFDIVVEEMLFGGAFPFDTLALIAWVVLLLAIALKWIFPFLLRKIALELPAERVGVASSCSDRKES